MVSDLYELSELVTKVANRIIELSAENTTDGVWTVEYDDVAPLIGEEDYLEYFDFIVSEVQGRSEVLDLDPADNKFNCIMAHNFCPNYQWQEGDENVFRCSKEEWEKTFKAVPVSKPLSMARMSEIGQAAIEDTLQNGAMAQELLAEALGMSMDEMKQLRIGEPDLDEYALGRGEDPEPELSEGTPPILFYVDDALDDSVMHKSYERFEDALERYKGIDSPDKSLSFLVFDEQGRGRGALLLRKEPGHGERICSLSEDEMSKNPHISLAHAKCVLHLYPNDAKAWKLRDAAEKALGIFDREADYSQDKLVGNWRIHLIPPGTVYGTHNQLKNDKGYALVEFLDTRYKDPEYAPMGQMAARYSIDTLLGRDGWNSGTYPKGLQLDSSVESWYVKPEEMKEVVQYLNMMDTIMYKKPFLNDLISRAEGMKAAPERKAPECFER